MTRHPHVLLGLGAVPHRPRKLDGCRHAGRRVRLQVIEVKVDRRRQRRHDLEGGLDVHRAGGQLHCVAAAHGQRARESHAQHCAGRRGGHRNGAAIHDNSPIAGLQRAAHSDDELGVWRDLRERGR